MTTMGTYLGSMLHPKPAAYPFILICVIFSAAAVYLWEFVIIPYDPVKYLNRSVRAFYHNVRGGVEAVRETLENGEGSQADLQRLERITQAGQPQPAVIEGLFAAAVSPSLWSQTRLNQLQEEMYKSERGLEVLSEASTRLSRHETPKEILESLVEGLKVLEEQFSRAATGEEQRQLYEIGEQLQQAAQDQPGGEIGRRVDAQPAAHGHCSAPACPICGGYPEDRNRPGCQHARNRRPKTGKIRAGSLFQQAQQEGRDKFAPDDHPGAASGAGCGAGDAGGNPAGDGHANDGLLDGIRGHRRVNGRIAAADHDARGWRDRRDSDRGGAGSPAAGQPDPDGAVRDHLHLLCGVHPDHILRLDGLLAQHRHPADHHVDRWRGAATIEWCDR